MPDISLIDVIAQDLAAVNADQERETGFCLKRLIAWKLKEHGTTRISLTKAGTSNALDPDDGNAFAEEIVKSKAFDQISAKCRADFILLATSNWQLFTGLDSKPLVERVLKKFVPLTSLNAFQRKKDAPLAYPAIKNDPFVVFLEMLIHSASAMTIVDIIAEIIEKRLDHVAWASSLVDVIDEITAADLAMSRWYLFKMSGILATCTVKPARSIFDGIIMKHMANEMLLDALLRAGSLSEDSEDDVLDSLERMDPALVATFIRDDARVLHRNYFLKLCMRKSPPRQEKADLLEYSRQKALKYIELSNPWALDRQFISWSKRISEKMLDPTRVNMLKGTVRKLMEIARHAMVTSDELATIWSKRMDPVDAYVAVDAKHRAVFFEELIALGIPAELVKAIADSIGGKEEPAPQVYHLVDFDGVSIVPTFLPCFNGEPWILRRGNTIVGLGLCNLRLKSIPAPVLSLDHLQLLDLSNNGIKHVDALGQWHDLKRLDLSRNLLTTFTPEGASPALQHLDLHCNTIKNADVTPFAGSLEILDLSRNQIVKIPQVKGMETCTKLETLNMAWNHLDSLQGLPALPTLATFFVNGNGLVKLAIEKDLPRVQRIDLRDNNLGALKGITKFPNVVQIDVSNNYLKNTREIDALSMLKTFLAKNNQLETLGGLQAMASLETLDVRGNLLPGATDDEKRKYLFSLTRFPR
nr:leucine-rich repeat domain-containing protein [Candidatus Sigynarchaeota archaeon]